MMMMMMMIRDENALLSMTTKKYCRSHIAVIQRKITLLIICLHLIYDNLNYLKKCMYTV